MPKTVPLHDLQTQEAIKQVRNTFERLQYYYSLRDSAQMDKFMNELFIKGDQLLIVGTGYKEWCQGLEAARELFEWDWEYWGDVNFDVDHAMIYAQGDTGWLGSRGSVTKLISPESFFRKTLNRVGEELESDLMPKVKLLEIARRIDNALLETEKGNRYIWPFRFTACLTREGGSWFFRQMHFSFPTTDMPDERLPGPEL